MDLIQCIETYVQVIQEGSFNAAARKLKTTSSAVSKRIQWLEDKIGIQLLKRTTRSLSITEAGSLFYDRSIKQLDSLQLLFDETRSMNDTPMGKLRIGASAVIGSKFIVRYVKQFIQNYPKVRLQLITTPSWKLPEVSYDIFISREHEQLNSLSLKATPLFEYSAKFYASQKYIDQYGEPSSFEDLVNHNVLICGEGSTRDITDVTGKTITVSGNFSSTNAESLLYCARDGVGIIFASNIGVQSELKKGLLLPILKHVTVDRSQVFAYYPKLEFEHQLSRLFLNYLKKQIALENSF